MTLKLLPAEGIFNIIEIINRENAFVKDELLGIYANIKGRGWEDKIIKDRTVRMIKLSENEVCFLKEQYESII